MTNGEKLKELFNTYFPEVALNEDNLAESCWIFRCPVESMPEEELEKLSVESGCACTKCSYDNWWNQEYIKEVVEFNVNIDILELIESIESIEELKKINQKTKELINAAYGNKALQEKTVGTDQFITKENEGGF